MKTFLIILLILIVLFILWWLFFRKKSARAAGTHERVSEQVEKRSPGSCEEPVPSSAGSESADLSAGAEISEADSYAAELQEDETAAADKSIQFPGAESSAATIFEESEAAATKEKASNPVTYLSYSVESAAGYGNLNGYKHVVAINVETPNSEHNRICNIGLSVLDESGRKSASLRINPEVRLDDVPDGMTAEDILNAPAFPAVWPELSSLFENSLVLAHNTAHDLNVLKKVLRAYNLEYSRFDIACTYRTSRKFHPEFKNHKLGTICEIYDIPGYQ